jgi:capsular polysaccharide biosynthesis protein
MISKTFSIQETSHHLTRKISIRRDWKSRLVSIRVTSGNEYRELPRQDVRDWKI